MPWKRGSNHVDQRHRAVLWWWWYYYTVVRYACGTVIQCTQASLTRCGYIGTSQISIKYCQKPKTCKLRWLFTLHVQLLANHWLFLVLCGSTHTPLHTLSTPMYSFLEALWQIYPTHSYIAWASWTVYQWPLLLSTHRVLHTQPYSTSGNACLHYYCLKT